MKSSFAVLTVALAALFIGGCDECEKATQTINDLTGAKALLEQGLANPTSWAVTCDNLVQSSEIFRSDADFLRGVADSRYTGISPGCLERGWVEYCHGGWGRFPDGQWLADASDVSATQNDGTFEIETLSPGHGGGHGGGGHGGGGHGGGGHGGGGHGGGGHGGGGHHGGPGHGGGHGGWHGHYPPHYPYHPGWRWGWAPRTCELVPVCRVWQPGVPVHPGYDHVMAIAYELDQAAGGIETACKKTRDGAPVDEVNTVATETLTRIEKNALPGATSVYDSLGCNARAGH